MVHKKGGIVQGRVRKGQSRRVPLNAFLKILPCILPYSKNAAQTELF